MKQDVYPRMYDDGNFNAQTYHDGRQQPKLYPITYEDCHFSGKQGAIPEYSDDGHVDDETRWQPWRAYDGHSNDDMCNDMYFNKEITMAIMEHVIFLIRVSITLMHVKVNLSDYAQNI